jgi:hypothetical protein
MYARSARDDRAASMNPVASGQIGRSLGRAPWQGWHIIQRDRTGSNLHGPLGVTGTLLVF